MEDSKSYWKEFVKGGDPFIWLTGASLALILLMAGTLFVVTLINGMTTFWPSQVATIHLKDGSRILGEILQETKHPVTGKNRIQLKIGNRDLYGLDFKWVERQFIDHISYDDEVIVLERMEYGNFYGFLDSVKGQKNATEEQLAEALKKVENALEELEPLADEISELNLDIEDLNAELRSLRYDGADDDNARVKELLAEKAEIQKKFEVVADVYRKRTVEIEQIHVIFKDIHGEERETSLAGIVNYIYPNQMNVFEKIWHYILKLRELLFDQPRESNTEGGLFPAIFGTVMMIIVMSIFTFPMGVIAAIYMKEYAKKGIAVKLVRIAVNNLAGIPSIVYGIFGLGFFVYGVGGQIDQLFFPEKLPTPTFGTGGILWASLTLAILTVPVVIVATEEALDSVPGGIREASLSLGATQWQTIWRVVLPMASPGILTGFILAMARAAGEVAPLMLTGAVKLAPALPLDGNFPFIHLERKFMHLGFHIYDVGFQSPNVEAAKPMVFVTALLLILIVVVLSSSAIVLRDKMKKRYTIKGF